MSVSRPCHAAGPARLVAIAAAFLVLVSAAAGLFALIEDWTITFAMLGLFVVTAVGIFAPMLTAKPHATPLP